MEEWRSGVEEGKWSRRGNGGGVVEEEGEWGRRGRSGGVEEWRSGGGGEVERGQSAFIWKLVHV